MVYQDLMIRYSLRVGTLAPMMSLMVGTLGYYAEILTYCAERTEVLIPQYCSIVASVCGDYRLNI